MICVERTYLECVIPEKNRKAYYRLVAGQDLFGLKLIRSWGRIGTQEKIRLQERFQNREEMNKAYRRIICTRLSHGYVVKELGQRWWAKTKETFEQQRKTHEQQTQEVERINQKEDTDIQGYCLAPNTCRGFGFNFEKHQ